MHRRGAARSPTNGHVKENRHRVVVKKKNRRLSLVQATIAGFFFTGILVLFMLVILPNDSFTTPAIRKQQQQQVATHSFPKPPETDVNHHLVFSTGCTTFQDWQSYILFFHALKVGQPGQVTRIASGCTPQEAEELKRLHEERISIMSDRFNLHLTPDFMTIKPGFKYKFFNKPFGLRHWMEHGLGYPDSNEHDDDIVILLDPDQMLLRPITNDFTGQNVEWKKTEDKAPPKMKVEHGLPFGELYGYAAQWKTKVNITHVTNSTNSPIENVTMPQARDHYPLGPPYIATARDMYSIAVKWCDFVPRTHDDYPHLLAEMFAFSLAAAHVQLPFQIALSFMVSDTTNLAEGWKAIDATPPDKVCYDVPPEGLPQVLHYCHRYLIGKYIIGKYRLSKDFITCEAPLLMEPPSDVGTLDFYIEPNQKEKSYHKKPAHKHRDVFMLCTMIHGLNEAATFFKQHNCDQATANYDKTYTFHDTMEIEA